MTLTGFGYSCLGALVLHYYSKRLLNCLAFQSYDFEPDEGCFRNASYILQNMYLPFVLQF